MTRICCRQFFLNRAPPSPNGESVKPSKAQIPSKSGVRNALIIAEIASLALFAFGLVGYLSHQGKLPLFLGRVNLLKNLNVTRLVEIMIGSGVLSIFMLQGIIKIAKQKFPPHFPPESPSAPAKPPADPSQTSLPDTNPGKPFSQSNDPGPSIYSGNPDPGSNPNAIIDKLISGIETPANVAQAPLPDTNPEEQFPQPKDPDPSTHSVNPDPDSKSDDFGHSTLFLEPEKPPANSAQASPPNINPGESFSPSDPGSSANPVDSDSDSDSDEYFSVDEDEGCTSSQEAFEDFSQTGLET